ncbi:MAG: hypothetical protein WKG07_37455 [Hymenobacter sp.]
MVPGVSRELAESRQQTISRVAYDLSLTVPADKAAPVQAEEIISFQLRDNRYPVQASISKARPTSCVASLSTASPPPPTTARSTWCYPSPRCGLATT